MQKFLARINNGTQETLARVVEQIDMRLMGSRRSHPPPQDISIRSCVVPDAAFKPKQKSL